MTVIDGTSLSYKNFPLSSLMENQDHEPHGGTEAYRNRNCQSDDGKAPRKWSRWRRQWHKREREHLLLPRHGTSASPWHLVDVRHPRRTLHQPRPGGGGPRRRSPRQTGGRTTAKLPHHSGLRLLLHLRKVRLEVKIDRPVRIAR